VLISDRAGRDVNDAKSVDIMIDDDGKVRTRDYLAALKARSAEDGNPTPADLAAVEFVTNITRMATRLVQDFEQVHRSAGISWAGFRLLAALWVIGDAEPTQLARLTGATKAAVSSAINTLERDGMVQRHHDVTDRRGVRVSMTEQGTALVHEATKRQNARERAWISVLSERELKALLRLLAKVVGQPTPPP
jgi:DNA-binding MarR family transcriptional regulator